MNRQKKFTPRRRMLVLLFALSLGAVHAMAATKAQPVYPTPSPTPPGPLRIDTGRPLPVVQFFRKAARQQVKSLSFSEEYPATA